MADEKKKEVEAPIFMVTSPPGFFDGGQLHQPGSKIYWSVPEGWDEEKQGKHYAHHAPSTTFRPMNDEAKALLEKTKKEKAGKK